MTREEEINKEVARYLFEDFKPTGVITEERFAIGVHMARWADENPKNAWISVEERLPEELQIVFVHMQGGSFDSAIYTNGAFERDLQLKFSMKDGGHTIISWQQKFKSNITHWMPIPELPKGGDE